LVILSPVQKKKGKERLGEGRDRHQIPTRPQETFRLERGGEIWGKGLKGNADSLRKERRQAGSGVRQGTQGVKKSGGKHTRQFGHQQDSLSLQEEEKIQREGYEKKTKAQGGLRNPEVLGRDRKVAARGVNDTSSPSLVVFLKNLGAEQYKNHTHFVRANTL